MSLNRGWLPGVLLVVLGILLFFQGDRSFDAGNVFAYGWPTMFVIPLGVFFHWMYFYMLNRKGVGMLVPGGILLVDGIVFQLSALTDSWSFTWPGYIFAVAFGLFELYWFGSRNRWLLIPITILTALSMLFFTVFSIGYLFSNLAHSRPILAAALILIGGLFILSRKREQQL
ncbi:hypothetical protein [Cohnella sp. AR92]|uniref:hypothetical protein n=1 Tax=Cohnella sp. AR92 TaxID=648716 RepID=UPI000F8CAD7B|nr:hypothetical protein [Cohnella sp. AR92]RUS49025.1 hypothetical protein ELR57_01385 [Cohnella sp. AR92]